MTAEHGLSERYAAALTGYAASVLVRKLKKSHSRGHASARHSRRPSSNRVDVNHIFTNEASLGFSYDYFETGLGRRPGHVALARGRHHRGAPQSSRSRTREARRTFNEAQRWRFRSLTRSLSAVVTDPPYDNMIDYSDASDLFYVWLKRALYSHSPVVRVYVPRAGRSGEGRGNHRQTVPGVENSDATTAPRSHYDTSIAQAFAEARRVVRPDGVVTIVFGHGDPEVWHRLLERNHQRGPGPHGFVARED